MSAGRPLCSAGDFGETVLERPVRSLSYGWGRADDVQMFPLLDFLLGGGGEPLCRVHQTDQSFAANMEVILSQQKLADTRLEGRGSSETDARCTTGQLAVCCLEEAIYRHRLTLHHRPAPYGCVDLKSEIISEIREAGDITTFFAELVKRGIFQGFNQQIDGHDVAVHRLKIDEGADVLARLDHANETLPITDEVGDARGDDLSVQIAHEEGEILTCFRGDEVQRSAIAW